MPTNGFAPRTKHEDRTRTWLYLAMQHESGNHVPGDSDVAGTLAYIRGGNVPLKRGSRGDISLVVRHGEYPGRPSAKFALTILMRQ